MILLRGEGVDMWDWFGKRCNGRKVVTAAKFVMDRSVSTKGYVGGSKS